MNTLNTILTSQTQPIQIGAPTNVQLSLVGESAFSLGAIVLRISLHEKYFTDVVCTPSDFVSNSANIIFEVNGPVGSNGVFTIAGTGFEENSNSIHLLDIIAKPIGSGGASLPIWVEVNEAVSIDGHPLFFQPTTHYISTVAAQLNIQNVLIQPIRSGVVFHKILRANGGLLPHYWEKISGDLPPGVDLHSSGILRGNPGETGNFIFDVKVTDAEVVSATAEIALLVLSAPLQINTRDLPEAAPGRNYEAVIVCHGGHPPFTWDVQGLENTGLSTHPDNPNELNELNLNGTLQYSNTLSERLPITVTVSDSEDPCQTTTKTIEIPIVAFLAEQTIEIDDPKAVAIGRDLILTDYEFDMSVSVVSQGGGVPQDVQEELENALCSLMDELVNERDVRIDPREIEYPGPDPDEIDPIPQAVMDRVIHGKPQNLPQSSISHINMLIDWLNEQDDFKPNNNGLFSVRSRSLLDEIRWLLSVIHSDRPSALMFYWVELIVDGYSIIKTSTHMPSRTPKPTTQGEISSWNSRRQANSLLNKVIASIVRKSATRLFINNLARVTNEHYTILESISDTSQTTLRAVTPGVHDVKVRWKEGAFENPDDLAFGSRGQLKYTVTITPSNQLNWPRFSESLIIDGGGKYDGEKIHHANFPGSDLDILVNGDNNELKLIAAIGDGSFDTPRQFLNNTVNLMDNSKLAVYPLDSTGRSSVVATRDNELILWMNDVGQFQQGNIPIFDSSLLNELPISAIHSFDAADLNSDDWMEIICGLNGRVATITGLNRLPSPSINYWSSNSPVDYDPVTALLCNPDIAQESNSEFTHLVLAQKLSGQVTIFENDGAGQFQANLSLPERDNYDPQIQPNSLAIHETHEGNTYLACSLYQAKQVIIWHMEQDGWLLKSIVNVPFRPNRIVVSPKRMSGFVIGGYLSQDRYKLSYVHVNELDNNPQVLPILETDGEVRVASFERLMIVSRRVENKLNIYR